MARSLRRVDLTPVLRRLPLPPLTRYELRDLPGDLGAAIAVCFLSVPAGLAYATIAGLPPVMGLYAAAIPTIVGSLFRSSRYVVAGPTNALSLLVGAAVATGLGGDPASVALTLALMVGVMQVAAGVLRLGTLVDYISGPVVLGYITGAGVLIVVGQLYNVTATDGPQGTLVTTLGGWLNTLPQTSGLAVGVALGTAGTIVVMRALSRRLGRRIPGAIVAMSLALALNLLLELEPRGLRVIADLSPIPAGLPSFGLPSLTNLGALLPVAVACTVLSLVESSAVARSLAARTGQRLDPSTEFVGQGLSNVAAGLWGGYPVSGSLTRSALNERSGARTRAAGVLTGTLMLGVLLAFGALLDHTPIASLAGLLLVVAWDLIDPPRILRTLRASRADAMALVATATGTWVLSLDAAIYLGVGLSVVLFLRRARLLVVNEMVLDEYQRWQECPLAEDTSMQRLPGVRVLQAEGPLFFGSVAELVGLIREALRDPEVRAIVLRLKRAQGMDATAAQALAEAATEAREQSRWLLLVGLSEGTHRVLTRSGAAQSFLPEHLIVSRGRRFEALALACERARALASERAPASADPSRD